MVETVQGDLLNIKNIWTKKSKQVNKSINIIHKDQLHNIKILPFQLFHKTTFSIHYTPFQNLFERIQATRLEKSGCTSSQQMIISIIRRNQSFS